LSVEPASAPPPADSAKPTANQAPVFLLTHEFYPRRGGIATFSEQIARAAAALGYDLEVWAQAAPAGVAEKPWPFRLRRLPLKGTHGLVCQLRLMRELVAHRRKLRYATVYLPEPGPMLAMMILQFVSGFSPPAARAHFSRLRNPEVPPESPDPLVGAATDPPCQPDQRTHRLYAGVVMPQFSGGGFQDLLDAGCAPFRLRVRARPGTPSAA